MAVNEPHPDYLRLAPMIEKCRDAIDGEEAVKNKGMAYLPMLKGQDSADYQSYNNRAMYYTAAYRTVKGLAGAVLRNPPQVTYPEEEALARIGINGESLNALIKSGLEEVLTCGRVLALVDMPSETDDAGSVEPYICMYKAEDVINWKTELVNGRARFTMLVLKERTSTTAADGFGHIAAVQYRVLRLSTTSDGSPGEYTVQIYTKPDKEKVVTAGGTKSTDWVAGPMVTPKARGGKSLATIPAVMIGVCGLSPVPDKPPILDLVNVNLSHFRTSADLEHGRHFTALPTLVLSGFEANGTIHLGSSMAIVSSDPNAKASFLEFTGSGLGHLAAALEHKQQLMAVLGARMLEQQTKGTEAAETVRLRQAGEQSVLANVAESVAEGFTWALCYAQLLLGQPLPVDGVKRTVQIELADDFGTQMIDPQLFAALMTALQSGQISWSTWFFNLKRGGIVPNGVDEDTERDLIEAAPMQQPPATLPPDGSDDTDPSDVAPNEPDATRTIGGAATGNVGGYS